MTLGIIITHSIHISNNILQNTEDQKRKKKRQMQRNGLFEGPLGHAPFFEKVSFQRISSLDETH